MPNDISKNLIFCFVQMNRTVFWMAGVLALLGLLWRSPLETSLLRGCLMTLALAVWVEFLILLSTMSFTSKNTVGRYDILFPAVLLGFLLPPPWIVLYAAWLGTVEIVRRIRTKTSHRKITALPISAEKMESEEEFCNDEIDDSITQQLVRHHTEAGTDRLEANYLVEFRNDQLTATIHVSFYPTFEFVPKIEVFCIDNVEIKWNVFEPRNFGVRIYIKRSSRETSRIRIMVVAECSKPTVF